ncbi:mycothiol synthase [Ornithinimicrobium faecis]|uniref:Mycothiol acetyltransferase n=1 Tax=Ornithinimicrobium faecis TaxID=2934158 RepID=A0ABY4YVB5_9MICO|nr:mycothiol synthase [Ornithinimicrobium sp. HY1793]USQ80711.1 mycothiol synthase [Ornithinimicrobium sp. HY1793]
MQPTATDDHLEPTQSADVLALAVRAATHDGVRPLSEQTVLDVRRLPGSPSGEAHTTHLVVEQNPDTPRPGVIAYAHVEHSDPPAAEIVVDPDHRHDGHGRALATEVLERWPGTRFWAHGDLPAAKALFKSLGLDSVRDLWQMTRPLRGEWSELPEVDLPEGFTVRPFEIGRDEQRWLDVNARSFADHPEQGRMTLADLQERTSEPWFDPQGFLLIEEGEDLAAFHWTKVEPAEPGHSVPTSGEVYVVGVDPAYQGRGLGKVTTLVGLHHLRNRGLGSATLYVEGDNDPALATYHRLGFERSAIDVMYAAPATT